MDYLPAVLPTYLREGIPYLRPPALRRAARTAYRAAQPVGARLTGGRWRTLPQPLTDAYLSRCVGGIRYFHPGVPVLRHPAAAARRAALRARHRRARAGGRRARGRGARREGVPMVDVTAIVARHLAAGALNPDGMHWGVGVPRRGRAGRRDRGARSGGRARYHRGVSTAARLLLPGPR